VKARILIVDDDPGTLASLSRAFALEGYTALTASSAARALERLDEEPVDAILSDVVMPEMDGLQFLAAARAKAPHIPVILMSGQATLETAMKATRLGALDFVEKPIGLDRLLLTLRNALHLDRLQRENAELKRYWQDELALIGESAAMASVRARVERVAASDASILILGENGTGKELVARAVHELSPRRGRPFVKMNCAAVPAELVESELFGHEKGAFSGAVGKRVGRFEQADGGTLFLDEIGDMPPPMQAKLLRVLQDGEITRVGGTGVVKVDVRVLSATNQDLDALLAAGRFREDLLYRINTVSIRVPPLRDRASDIPALAAHFAGAASRRNHWKPRALAPDALALLRQQPWKGNVRELRNVVERALILGDADPLGADDVRQALPAGAAGSKATVAADGPLAALVDEYERDVIRQRLKQMGGHVTNAARSLGLERSHLYKKCKQLGIDVREEG
jgi:two-component system, NtrC family, nitrogen regulation response regulator NtrX